MIIAQCVLGGQPVLSPARARCARLVRQPGASVRCAQPLVWVSRKAPGHFLGRPGRQRPALDLHHKTGSLGPSELPAAVLRPPMHVGWR